jgi:pimeloyl-ACP methyl ester carboxylesterase
LPGIEIGGVRYSYLEAGTGPLLIFGHGTFGGEELFRSQVDALASHYRCVAVDWPGHGESGYDPAGWTVQSLVDAVSAWEHAASRRR